MSNMYIAKLLCLIALSCSYCGENWTEYDSVLPDGLRVTIAPGEVFPIPFTNPIDGKFSYTVANSQGDTCDIGLFAREDWESERDQTRGFKSHDFQKTPQINEQISLLGKGRKVLAIKCTNLDTKKPCAIVITATTRFKLKAAP